MKFFLVDYENVNSSGLNGIDLIGQDDHVVIFYGPNSNTVSFSIMQKIREMDIEIELYELKQSAHNAIDFQLSVYLGYLIAKYPEAEFYIISKDKGYQAVIEFCKDNFISDNEEKVLKYDSIMNAVNRNSFISIEICVNNSNMQECEITSEKIEADDEYVRRKVLSLIEPIKHNFGKSDKKEVGDVITECVINSNSKEEFHNKLVQKYKIDLGSKCYKLLKSEYPKLKAL